MAVYAKRLQPLRQVQAEVNSFSYLAHTVAGSCQPVIVNNPLRMITERAPARTTDADKRARTARQLVEPLEWAGFAFQAALLLQTATIDPYAAYGRVVIFSLAIGHLLACVYALRVKGPLSHGKAGERSLVRRSLVRREPGMTLWLGAAFVVPVIIALLSARGTYGTGASCVPGCSYPSPPLLFTGLYPWLASRLLRRRTAETLVLCAVPAELLLLILLTDGKITWISVESVGSSTMWALAAFGIGRVLARLGEIVQRREAQAARHADEHFGNAIHSRIKPKLMVIEAECAQAGQPAGLLEQIKELERSIGDIRAEFLSEDQVVLATLWSRHAATFGDLVTESPRYGARTVGREVGAVISNALGDLLSNAAKHGAQAARVHLDASGNHIELTVTDDGPGFDDRVLDDASTSLNSLRSRARRLGGELRRYAVSPRGSRMVLSLPEFPAETGRD